MVKKTKRLKFVENLNTCTLCLFIISHVNKQAYGTVKKNNTSSIGKVKMYVPIVYSSAKNQCLLLTSTSHNKNGTDEIIIDRQASFQ